ncbi:hypothetical protein [Actinomyces oricola]|uniref:hypothetical protein n=1 Tax=Actinomyces oricola TaxID=206043 RepID=UPI000FFF6295|nr:hypothetical protein [Actinomyces oricola]
MSTGLTALAPSTVGRAAATYSPLTRLTLRRERRSLLAWALGAGLLSLYCATAFTGMYGTPQERATAALTYTTPGSLVFTGPGFGLDAPDPTLGALFATAVLGYLALVACLMGVLTSVARTRKDEEDGPGELLRAAPVAHGEGARAAAACVASTSLAIGLLSALAAICGSLEVVDSLVMGLTLALAGMVAGGAGLILAALAPSARAASGSGSLLVVLWFLLRGIGDVSDSAGLLSWLTPIGLVQQARPYAGLRWQPAALLALAAAVLIGVGLLLHSRRELGEGLLAGRRGGGRHRPGPRGAVALALRTCAPTRWWWMLGGVVFGACYGVFAPSIEDTFAEMFRTSPLLRDFMGGDLTVRTYLSLLIGYGSLLGGACAVALAAGGVTEEGSGRAATVLAAPVSRVRLLAGRVAVVAVGAGGVLAATAAALSATAVSALVASGSPVADEPWRLVAGIAVGAVSAWPAGLLAGAIVLALHALVPRLARPVGWGLFLLVTTIQVLGPLARAPQWLLNLSPFAHRPDLPASTGLWGQAESWAGPGVCLLGAVALTVLAGFVARRRDLVG